MDAFSPYEPLIFACILLSLPVFYVLGAFFTPRLSTPWRNVAARAAMGALVFTFGLAVWHAGVHTMLLPFILVMIMQVQLKPKGLIKDVINIPIFEWLIASGIILAIILFEMAVNDVRDGDSIVIGNWDYANSGGIGFDLYHTHSESLRSLFDSENNRVFHHFADHWLAGFYSKYFGILPYYSYIVIYRVIGELLLLGLLSAWCLPIMNRFKWIVPFIAYGAFWIADIQHLPGFNLLEKSLGIVNIDDVLWSCAPYFLFAAGVLMFSLWITEGNLTSGVVGILLLPGVHPAATLLGPVAVSFLLVLKLCSRTCLSFSYKQLLLWLIIAILPYLYAEVDGRMYKVDAAQLLSKQFLIDALKNLWGAGLSLLVLFPFLWGVYTLCDENKKGLFWLQVGLFVGIVLNHSLVFTMMGGDSEQLFILYITALLIPSGLVGLVHGIFNEKGHYQMHTACCIAIVILSSCVRLYKIGVHNGSIISYSIGQDEEWISGGKISNHEAQLLKMKLTSDELTDVLVALHPDSAYHENGYLMHHTFLRGLLAGTEFHRANILPIDTFAFQTQLSRYAYFKRSTLWHCFQESTQTSTQTSLCMLQYYNTKYLLLDTLYPKLFTPIELQQSAYKIDTLGRFMIVSIKSTREL